MENPQEINNCEETIRPNDPKEVPIAQISTEPDDTVNFDQELPPNSIQMI